MAPRSLFPEGEGNGVQLERNEVCFPFLNLTYINNTHVDKPESRSRIQLAIIDGKGTLEFLKSAAALTPVPFLRGMFEVAIKVLPGDMSGAPTITIRNNSNIFFVRT